MTEIARYTRTAMLLHWAIAALILLNVALGLSFTYGWVAPDDIRPMITFHKSTGMLALVLLLLRLAWRTTHTPPALPATYHAWEANTSHVVHVLLYVVALGLPLSGWAHDSAGNYPYNWYGLFHAPNIWFIANLPPAAKLAWHGYLGTAHTWFGYALYVLLAAHLGGALKHQFIDKEPEIQRMLPGE